MESKRKKRRTTIRRRTPATTPAIDFINFVVKFWYFFTIIFALIVSVTYYVIELKEAHKTIRTLTENMSKLTENMSNMQKENENLKGLYDNINLSIQQINEKLPGDLKSRLDTLEIKVNGQPTRTGAIQNGAASSR